MFIYPDDIKKYSGTLIVKNNKIDFKIKKKNRIYNIRSFKFEDYNNSKDDTMDIAIKYKKKWSIANNMVQNYMELIETEKEPYYKVYYSEGKYFIIDKEDEYLIQKYSWIKNNNYIATLIKNENGKKYIPFHKFKLDCNYIEHLNNNKLDNRSCNLKKITCEQLGWKKQHCNKKLRSDNKEGKTGIYKGKYKNYEYYEVKGLDYNRKKIYKKFNINKYGENNAKKLASLYRDKYIEESYV
jgi:hypothetical protein